ncbi:MAG: hypothetical protein K8S25_12440 [Alphaproteobacteria bacterium]|nr:hypothetical protein [Alphaproteobacteria bacterium]
MRLKTVAISTLLALSLAACGTGKFDDDPDYAGGFSDGCATGTARSTGTPTSKAVRDDALWRESEGYRVGWKQGYAACSPSNGGDVGGR